MKIKDVFVSKNDPEIVPVEWYLERYRNWRETELKDTDWTQLTDAPVDSSTYAIYRQKLRDLPIVEDFANAEFPVKP